jgi:hypothetical protein
MNEIPWVGRSNKAQCNEMNEFWLKEGGTTAAKNKEGGWVPGRRKEDTVIEEKSLSNFHERKGKEGFGYYLGRDVGIKVGLND